VTGVNGARATDADVDGGAVVEPWRRPPPVCR